MGVFVFPAPSGGGGGGGGDVDSVFGRTGAVVAQSGDYTAALVTNALDLSTSQAANTGLLAPSGVSGSPTFRTLVEADLPQLVGTGISTVPVGISLSARALATLNVPRGHTIYLPRRTAINERLAINVSTAVTSQIAVAGLYTASGNLIFQSSAFDLGGSTGIRTYSGSPRILEAGIYRLVVAADTTSSSLSGSTATSAIITGLNFVSEPYHFVATNAMSGSTLPATLGALSSAAGYIFIALG
jgi:hypothetical protein